MIGFGKETYSASKPKEGEMEDTRFIPGIIKLFIVLIIAGAIAGTIEWLFENPVILIPVLVLIGGIVYFWIRGRRARTVV